MGEPRNAGSGTVDFEHASRPRGDGDKQHSDADGEQLSLWRCMATFSGTWVSAASILSLTGSVYESGYNVVLYSV